MLDNYEGDKEAILKMLENYFNGLPDLICLKDNIISFVEVKANNSKLSKIQENIIKKFQELGYGVSIQRVNIGLDIRKD